MRWRAILAGTLALAAATAACGGGGGAAAPTPAPSATPSVLDGCTDAAARAALVSAAEARFTASDGVRLTAAVFGTGKRGVVLGHMGGAPENLCSWAAFAGRLASKGFHVLALDFRGFGSSERVTGDRQWRQDRDVVAAVAELRRRGAGKVVIGGASLGAIASMLASQAVTPPVNGVINVAGPSVVEAMDARGVPAKLTIPALYIVAESDLEVLQDIQDQHAATKATDKKLVILPGWEHGTRLFGGASAARFEQEMSAFVERVTA